MQKNVAGQKWVVFAFNRGNQSPVTGDAANITAKIRRDHGSAAALGDTNPTEIEDGYYEFDLTQAETNGDRLHILPESSTSGVQVIGVPGTLQTVPAGFTGSGFTNTVADAILQRNVSSVEGAAPEHSLCTVILAMLESSISGTTWTITRTDGTTTHATKTVTRSPSADRITGVT